MTDWRMGHGLFGVRGGSPHQLHTPCPYCAAYEAETAAAKAEADAEYRRQHEHQLLLTYERDTP